MITLITCALSLLVYTINAAPLLSNNHDAKMINGQPSYREFNFFDLPVIGKRPTLQMAADTASLVGDRPVRAGLAVIASAEAENTDLSPFAGYGEARATEAEIPKTSDMFVIRAPTEAAENQPSNVGENFKQVGVVPKFTGRFLGGEPKTHTDEKGAAIVNPSAYFLGNLDLDKVPKPKCRLIGCDGPIVEDDIFIGEQSAKGEGSEKCHQAFVPIVDAEIRVGMTCRICCEASDLVAALKKTKLHLDSN